MSVQPLVARWSPNIRNLPSFLLVLPMVVLLAVLVIYPLVLLIQGSATNGFSVYARLFTLPSVWKAIGTTFLCSLIVTVTVLIVASILAWTIRTTQRSWLRYLCWGCVLMPFWMGTIVKNYAIVIIISNDGVINQLLRAIGLQPVHLMYTIPAVVLGIAYSLVPFAVLSIYSVFRSLDLNLIRTAEVLGSTRSGAILRIMIPQAVPGFIAAGALVFALAVGFYVTPIVLGGAQSPFLASLIQADILSYFDFPSAAALSVILLVSALLIMGVALVLAGWRSFARALTRS